MTGYNAHIIARSGQAGLRQTNCNEEIINSDNCLLSSDLTNEKHSQSSTQQPIIRQNTGREEREVICLELTREGGREGGRKTIVFYN